MNDNHCTSHVDYDPASRLPSPKAGDRVRMLRVDAIFYDKGETATLSEYDALNGWWAVFDRSSESGAKRCIGSASNFEIIDADKSAKEEAPSVKDDGGPAFPGQQDTEHQWQAGIYFNQGMTLLDHFAGQVAAGVCASGKRPWPSPEDVSSYAYGVARALIAEKNKP